MELSFRDLFFPRKQLFTEEKRTEHERHHRAKAWVYYSTMVAGLWLIAGPSAFGYVKPAMIWSDLLSGLILIILSYRALGPYDLGAQWGVVFMGIWLFIAPMIFSAAEGAALLNDLLLGTVVVVLGIIIPGQPGIKLYAQSGPNVPAGWSYNPSSWEQRIPVIFLSWLGFFVSRYMAAFQLGYIDSVWDPFFNEGTRDVLLSDVSKAFPVSDALLGGFSYILDILFAYAGGTHRWRTMPWVVILFGILIVPLGVVSITLVILQPVAVGAWCTLCLGTATISLLMIPLTLDEVLATLQMMGQEKRQRGVPYSRSLWFGGTMEGGKVEEMKDPTRLLERTGSDMIRDIFSRPLNLAVIILLGIWIMASPTVLEIGGGLVNNNYVIGALIITFAVIAMSDIARTLRFINIPFGLWLIAAPWVFGTEGPALWAMGITGVALVALSFPKGRLWDERGGFERYVK